MDQQTIKHLIPIYRSAFVWTICTVILGRSALALAAIDPDSRIWTPGIGDPTFYGWITVLTYLGTAGLLFANRQLAKRLGLSMNFWLLAGLFMLLLGINKQLDLQTWFTQMGRDLAKAQGWYANRRIVQTVFIGLLFASGVVAAWAMQRWTGRAWREYRLCTIGLIVTIVFIIVRAATFHHVDKMLGLNCAGLRLNVVLELGGIGLVLTGAAAWRSRVKTKS